MVVKGNINATKEKILYQKHSLLPEPCLDGHTLPLQYIKLGMELGFHKVGLKDAENCQQKRK